MNAFKNPYNLGLNSSTAKTAMQKCSFAEN